MMLKKVASRRGNGRTTDRKKSHSPGRTNRQEKQKTNHPDRRTGPATDPSDLETI
jgi:hypothetical protein